MKRIFTIILFILLTPSFLIAQDKVRYKGKVVDANNQPLTYAIISIEGEGNLASTNLKGLFELSIPASRQKLSISLLGYKTLTKEIDPSINRFDTFVMKEDYHLLNAVEVIAPNASQKMQQSAYLAKGIDIRQYANSLSNLNQIVSHSSGIILREDGGIGANFDLSLNGLSGNAVKYFIDGIPISSFGANSSIANIPLNLVDRVEIYKGVVPPEFGLDALGGVINIVTRQRTDNYLEVVAEGGSFHTFKGNIQGQLRNKKSCATLRSNIEYTSTLNNYLMKGVKVWNSEKFDYEERDLPRFHDAYKLFQGNVSAGFTGVSWADEALIGVHLTNSFSEIQTGFSQDLVIGAANRTKDATRLSVNYSKQDLLTEGLSVKAFYSYTWDHTLYNDTTFRKYSWDGSYVETHYSEIMRRNKMLRHTQRPSSLGRVNIAYQLPIKSYISFNYMGVSTQNKRTDDYDQTFIPTNDFLASHIFGLSYNQHLWEERISSTIFFKDYLLRSKIEQQDMYWITGSDKVDLKLLKNYIGGGAAVRATLYPALSVKTSYERAVRLPTAREYLGNGASIYPNFTLRPERSHNLNIGVYGNWHLTNAHSLNYETTFFYRDVTDYIYRVVTGDVESTYQNVGAARVMGAELEFKYRYKDIFELVFNTTYNDERNRKKVRPNGMLDNTYNYRIPNKPYYYANILSSYMVYNPFSLPDSWLRIDLSASYVKWFYLSWEAYGVRDSKAIVPTQTCVNAGITWAFDHDKYALSLRCDNLFDTTNYDNYKLQKPGRAIFCKLKAFFN